MPKSRRATITDVAARAGVSKTAVSKVLNGTGSISAATRDRVLQAARDLHWRPSAHAVALRRARSQTVALVLNRHEAP
uniref:LacI family DNA-binding transcriptional regulator n=1 Tax=Desertihabitans aurantiacus TaxID=2282477 RepID=UPI001E49A4CE